MDWRVLAMIAVIGSMLLVSGCAKSNALTGNGSADVEEVTEGGSEDVITDTPVETPTVETSAPDEALPINDAPKSDELANVTEAPTYDEFRNTCTEDSKGVVRTFDGEGNKQVHRNTCLSGILTDFKCVDNKAASDNHRCAKGCTTNRYGALCKE